MIDKLKQYNMVMAPVIFTVMPLLFWALGDVPRRSLLKESISILTILGFFMMLGQFYLSRGNNAAKIFKIVKVVKVHKILGYIFTGILLLHPFLVAIPRYFEAGIQPVDAFTEILSNAGNKGVLLGLCAWGLMLIIGILSLLRNRLGIQYKTWRVIHGTLSIGFIGTASWHAIDLGRHTNLPMSVYIFLVAAFGVLPLVKIYLIKEKKGEES